LGALDGQVDSIFNAGAEAAKNTFENYVNSRMQSYKEERYSGPVGWAKWAIDKLLGMPSEVNTFFQQGRQLYIDQMDGVIDNVVSVIGESLQQAKAAIRAGRGEIDAYIAQLPADLQEVGQQAAGEIMESCDQLDSQLEDTQNALINEITDMYKQHLQEIDSRVAAMRAENEGLLQQALDVIKGVIQTILQLKDKLISILASAASAVQNIIKDPISFLRNLISAVTTGFQSFFGNIATHLTSGLITWLAETLVEAGIDLPESFDLNGLFGMVMQVLGVTWDTVRDRAAALLGDNVVSILERGFEVFITLKNEGLAGIWDFVSNSLGNLQEIILEPIREFLVTQVIQNGIQKILGVLGNPVGAFIEAVQGIYNVIQFFVGQARSIASLVRVIIGSMADLASGAVGQTFRQSSRSWPELFLLPSASWLTFWVSAIWERRSRRLSGESGRRLTGLSIGS
jgi:phage-related protein